MKQTMKRLVAAGALAAALWVATGSRPVSADQTPVNINTASSTELITLKGIGAAKAQDILDYRDKHGPFKSVDDLRQIRGFGDKLVEQLRPHITVSSAAAPAAASAKH